MRQMHKQKGMSSLSLLSLALVVGFIAMCVIKLAPVYMDYMSVKGIVDGLSEEPGIKTLSKKKVLSILYKRIDVNGIRDFDFDSFIITRNKNTLDVELDYEVRQELISNIDVVVKFYHINEIDL